MLLVVVVMALVRLGLILRVLLLLLCLLLMWIVKLLLLAGEARSDVFGVIRSSHCGDGVVEENRISSH